MKLTFETIINMTNLCALPKKILRSFFWGRIAESADHVSQIYSDRGFDAYDAFLNVGMAFEFVFVVLVLGITLYGLRLAETRFQS